MEDDEGKSWEEDFLGLEECNGNGHDRYREDHGDC